MINYLKLHLQFIAMKYQSRLAYRFDMLVSTLTFFLFQFLGILSIAIIYNAGGMFPGWTLPNMVLLAGTLSLVKGFSFMLFFGILWNTQDIVRSGELDLYLLRPINTLYLVVMDSFDEEDLGQTIGGIVLLIIGFTLNPHISGSIFIFILLIVVGILFFFSLALLSSAITILFINTRRIYEFIDLMTVIAGYPKTIYSRTATLAFSTILPLIIIANVPAGYILGIPPETLWLSIICVIILMIISIVAWYATIRKYTSAGG